MECEVKPVDKQRALERRVKGLYLRICPWLFLIDDKQWWWWRGRLRGFPTAHTGIWVLLLWDSLLFPSKKYDSVSTFSPAANSSSLNLLYTFFLYFFPTAAALFRLILSIFLLDSECHIVLLPGASNVSSGRCTTSWAYCHCFGHSCFSFRFSPNSHYLSNKVVVTSSSMLSDSQIQFAYCTNLKCYTVYKYPFGTRMFLLKKCRSSVMSAEPASWKVRGFATGPIFEAQDGASSLEKLKLRCSDLSVVLSRRIPCSSLQLNASTNASTMLARIA